MEEKVNGLVIKSVEYGENDKILTLFTVEKGVISAKIKGVKKAGAKLKFASEPFCFAEYILVKRGTFYSVIGASLHDSFYPLRENIINYYAGAVILEFIKKFCPENVLFQNFILDTVNALKNLAYEDKKSYSVLLKFILKGLNAIGYGVDFFACESCGSQIKNEVFFDFDNGHVLCRECIDEKSVQISPDTYFVLKGVSAGEEVNNEKYEKRALNMLNYYLGIKTGEKLVNFKEYITLLG